MPAVAERLPVGALGAAASGILHLSAGGWRVAGAVVVGPAHARACRDGQDACAVGSVDDVLVLAVADGAGSAVRGGLGARLVVESLLVALRGRAGRAPWRSRLEGALDRAEAALAAAGGDPAELRATLVGLVVRGGHGLMFNIGDGVALACDRTGACLALSPADGGEHAGETYFLTDPGWRRRLRWTPFRGAASLAVMTDGVTPFALERGGAAPARSFMDPVLDCLRAHPPALAGRALERLLGSAEAGRVSGDDKTLVCAVVEPGGG